jgi:hypothetical protein
MLNYVCRGEDVPANPSAPSGHHCLSMSVIAF